MLDQHNGQSALTETRQAMIIMKTLYKRVLKPILFKFDPELVHDVFVSAGELMGRFSLTRGLIGIPYRYNGPDISRNVDGIRHHTPISLAAGFDYNGRLTRILPSVGFGGDEIGSVTARPCDGNQPPRLRRCIKSGALVVSKGLRNDGVDAFIRKMQQTPREPGFVLGVSIARTNDDLAVGLEEGIEDYATSLRKLVEANVGDFYTINISCPNVHGGESFAEPGALRHLLERLMAIEHDKPVYAKMPINLPWPEFKEIADIVVEFGLDGVVIGNLNKHYDDLRYRDEAPAEYAGGLSGTPCRDLSTALIRQTREQYGDDLTIIGCGGIMTAEDAMEKFRAGADLLQLITGMIFEGPHLMKDIGKACARNRHWIRGDKPRRSRAIHAQTETNLV
jgi:dihydroorotate dehydrogenase